MTLLLAASGGATIFGIFLVVMLFVLAYAMYTRKGSGISQRPQGNQTGAAGAEGPSRIANAEDSTEGAINAHGTKA